MSHSWCGSARAIPANPAAGSFHCPTEHAAIVKKSSASEHGKASRGNPRCQCPDITQRFKNTESEKGYFDAIRSRPKRSLSE